MRTLWIATGLLPVACWAQTFVGTIDRHEVGYQRETRCPVGNSSDRGTLALGVNQREIAIPSAFGCPAQAFNSGKLALELPATLSSTGEPTTTATIEAPAPTVAVTVSGQAGMLQQSETSHQYTALAELPRLRAVGSCTTRVLDQKSRGSVGFVSLSARAAGGIAALEVSGTPRREGGRSSSPRCSTRAATSNWRTTSPTPRPASAAASTTWRFAPTTNSRSIRTG